MEKRERERRRGEEGEEGEVHIYGRYSGAMSSIVIAGAQ